MRIIFLGTSHGVPEANRRCSSVLIEAGEHYYIFDMGTQAIEQLITRNIPIEAVKGIFITHMHGDHTNGLISFVDLCNWYFTKATPVICLPEPMEKTIETMKAWYSCNGSVMRDYCFQEVKEGLVLDDGNIKVTAFRTKHVAVSYAYLIEAEGKRVLITGDLCHQGPENDFPVSVLEEPLDLAICEAAHFHADNYLPILKKAKQLRKFCITHHTKWYMPLDSEKWSEIPLMIAADGMEIRL